MLRVNDVDVFDTADELLDPKHTALLVIDMQNEMGSNKGGYAKNGYDNSRILSVVPAIQKVLAAGRSANLPIIYTEFIHRNRDGTTRMDGPNVYMHRKAHWISPTCRGQLGSEVAGPQTHGASGDRYAERNGLQQRRVRQERV